MPHSLLQAKAQHLTVGSVCTQNPLESEIVKLAEEIFSVDLVQQVPEDFPGGVVKFKLDQCAIAIECDELRGVHEASSRHDFRWLGMLTLASTRPSGPD